MALHTPATGDLTCRNWTSSSEGRAQVGITIAAGNRGRELVEFSPRFTRLRSVGSAGTGGAGLFYCFGID